MNEEQRELLFDLLAKKAVYGLDDAEQARLDGLDDGTAEREFRSLEITAAAVSLAGLSDEEPMPDRLQAKLAAAAEQFFAAAEPRAAAEPWPPAQVVDDYVVESPPPSIFGWLGWAAAAAACIALAFNIWFNEPDPVQQVKTPPVAETPQVLTVAEMREQLISSTSGLVRAAWAPGNVKDIKQISGDVVWSDEKQAGYLRLSGLPVNDAQSETYQLWIFDKTQDPATPIDGGTFDINSDGEVVVPINAKLKADDPSMFAVTLEKAGGVVVSKREKIAALAKVETRAS